MFSPLQSHLTLGHITGDRFPVFHYIVVPFPLALFNAVLPIPMVDPGLSLFLVMIWSLVMYWGWVICVVHELSSRAGFLVFSVNPEYLRSLKGAQQ